ncbi:unnamed protein product [Macrosiphum euphorbiae]|nr:unnamed protein product [Macrosiphum euphorbiae]
MSDVIVVGLLALLLASQSSNCQVNETSQVKECQVDETPAMVIVDDQVDRISAVAIANDLPGPWISELFYRALSNFRIQHVGSAACQTQSDMYDRHLRNHTSWAVRMAESWNRYPTGLREY